MAIRFVIDSASDILPDEAKQWGMTFVPMTVTIGGVEYADGITLTHKQFYEKLIESDALPTTSQVSPDTFAQVFREIAAAGDTAVAITMSSKLSGTCQSAMLAAREFPGQVYVLDSENVCVGERMLVLRAMALAEQGLSAEELMAQLEREKKDVRVLAILDTLEYLKKGGRISAATAFAGNILGIKPVVAVVEGEVAMVGKARGSRNGSNLLRCLVDKSRGIDFNKPYCVAYSGLSDTLLRKYIEDSADLWRADAAELPICMVGSTIGTHVGPGAIAVSFFEKEQ